MKHAPSKYKQVIAVRKDLAMDAGKLGAQTAHATKIALLGDFRPAPGEPPKESLTITLTGVAAAWLQDEFTTIIVEVADAVELLTLCEQARAAGLLVGEVVDNGRTVFDEKTLTCAAIGPATPAQLNPITGHLKSYKGASKHG